VAATLTVVPLTVFVKGGHTAQLTVAAAALAAVTVYATVMHPLSIFLAFAVVLGAVPFAYLPGTKIQVILVLSLGVWVALAFLPDVRIRLGWPEYAVVVFVLVAVMSAVVTGLSVEAIKELAAWIAPTAVVVPLRFLPHSAMTRMVSTFVVSAGAAGALGILLVIVDPAGARLGLFTFAGYRPDEVQARFVMGSEGSTLRLAGTFVEPNVAGLILAAALLLAIAYFRGWARATLVLVTGAALLLTLSRTAGATAVVAGLLLLLRLPGRQRIALATAGGAATALGLAIPVVRQRLLDSFGPTDTGTVARNLAFTDFPDVMAGHWIWGLGWVREEFREAAVSFAVNPVSNALLISVYRAGIVVGLVALVIMAALVVRAWRATRGEFVDRVIGCTVIAFALVALQLDVPVALQAPGTALFSLLVALLIRAPDQASQRDSLVSEGNGVEWHGTRARRWPSSTTT
jgi:hypothetical protein